MKKEKTKEQALKAILILFIVTEAIAVICLALGFIISGLWIFGLIFGASFALGGVYIYFSYKKAIKRSFCRDCGTKYDFNNDITWEEVERVEKDSKEISKVEFTCKCPNCGKTQEFSYNFMVSFYDKSKGRWIEKNLETMARKYFWK